MFQTALYDLTCLRAQRRRLLVARMQITSYNHHRLSWLGERSQNLGHPAEEFWKRARVVMPRGKTSVHLRLDSDVFEWFKKQGEGHLTRMNAVLRSYVNAQKD